MSVSSSLSAGEHFAAALRLMGYGSGLWRVTLLVRDGEVRKVEATNTMGRDEFEQKGKPNGE